MKLWDAEIHSFRGGAAIARFEGRTHLCDIMAMSSAWTNSTAPGPAADESSMANMFVLVAAMSGLVYTAAVDKSEGEVPAFLTVDNLQRRV